MAHVSIQICFLFTMLDNPQMSEDTAKLLWTSQKWLLVNCVGDQPSGGARRDRTDDLMLAKHALSQLSYSPLGECEAFAGSATAHSRSEWRKRHDQSVAAPPLNKMVGLGGLEPPTSRLSSARSNQLSYKPEPCTQGAWLARARDRARPGRKRNEDGGFPLDRPDWPCCSKCSNRRASSPGGTSLERR